MQNTNIIDHIRNTHLNDELFSNICGMMGSLSAVDSDLLVCSSSCNLKAFFVSADDKDFSCFLSIIDATYNNICNKPDTTSLNGSSSRIQNIV